MSDTPIYDQLSEMQKFAHRNGAYNLKYEILKWVEAEISAGRLKKTIDVEKIINGIEGIKTWESTLQNENQSTGSGSGTGSKTSGTRSRSPRSNAGSKSSKAGSKPTSPKASK
jgi:hypothetical protein